ncbi:MULTISPECIES: hypothetical protein [Streptomyces]|uniref:hypothetical protein n=1 Tax=Streptomyces TaxID=1883 RepID=UPI00163C3A6B|nr:MULTISPECIES: hypothetical protein [Streptomyces]MBC2878580.1 hypothetical protein [Streptomyces sp. TYQ1024]UBI35238.1 hypothetical protein K7I03_01370 [Streptomyces mobaraensis]UKW27829.1 hypothetical protein MCU78_01405 [Streptomyces sp. TYQ1024]
MSDIHELRLDWHLRADLPAALLTELRGHLAPDPDGEREPAPLLDATGPAWRVGGVLSSVLAPLPDGWALVVRQEVHTERLDELRELLDRLAPHTVAAGAIGSLRFYEYESGEVLEVCDGVVRGFGS